MGTGLGRWCLCPPLVIIFIFLVFYRANGPAWTVLGPGRADMDGWVGSGWVGPAWTWLGPVGMGMGMGGPSQARPGQHG